MRQKGRPAGVHVKPFTRERRIFALPSLRSFFGPVAIGVSIACLGCGTPPPRPPNPTVPLAERRAVEIIVATLKRERDEAVLGRLVTLPGDKPLIVDVTAAGHKWGIAYLTSRERHSLGAAVPLPASGMEEALHLVRGTGPDFDSKILVLHDTNYLYDDEMGQAHQVTIATAEAKLERDVRDFAIRAHAEKWP
jgi:hypothetical protein